MTLLTLALPFTAAAADGKKCDVSLAVESNGDKKIWDTKAAIQAAAAKQGVDLNVLVYPASGTPDLYIVRNGKHGEKLPISQFSAAAEEVTQECLNGGAQAVTVSTPDLTR